MKFAVITNMEVVYTTDEDYGAQECASKMHPGATYIPLATMEDIMQNQKLPEGKYIITNVRTATLIEKVKNVQIGLFYNTETYAIKTLQTWTILSIAEAAASGFTTQTQSPTQTQSQPQPQPQPQPTMCPSPKKTTISEPVDTQIEYTRTATLVRGTGNIRCDVGYGNMCADNSHCIMGAGPISAVTGTGYISKYPSKDATKDATKITTKVVPPEISIDVPFTNTFISTERVPATKPNVQPVVCVPTQIQPSNISTGLPTFPNSDMCTIPKLLSIGIPGRSQRSKIGTIINQNIKCGYLLEDDIVFVTNSDRTSDYWNRIYSRSFIFGKPDDDLMHYLTSQKAPASGSKIYKLLVFDHSLTNEFLNNPLFSRFWSDAYGNKILIIVMTGSSDVINAYPISTITNTSLHTLTLDWTDKLSVDFIKRYPVLKDQKTLEKYVTDCVLNDLCLIFNTTRYGPYVF